LADALDKIRDLYSIAKWLDSSLRYDYGQREHSFW